MRALLDGDIYAFRSAASSENDDLGIAIWRMEEMIDNTLSAVGADVFSIFLSGDTNFRHSIYPEYKANRTQPKPRFLKECKQHLIEKYNAVVSVDCEADDLLGIEQCAYQGRFAEPETVICSIDKDLRMIPGNHYSFEISGKITRGPNAGDTWTRPAEHVFITPEHGLRNFYYQLLVGDSTDNIKGASGIGPKKANIILDEAMLDWAAAENKEPLEQYYFNAARCHFSSDEELLMTGQCLWIFRKPNDRWQVPSFS